MTVSVDDNRIHVINDGKTAALVHKVDVFWYRKGRINFISNMPDIAQVIEPRKEPIPLTIPKIPSPTSETAITEPSFMKMVIRFHALGIPVFRYSPEFYFKYDWEVGGWMLVKNIPNKYKALGKTGLGDITPIRIQFPLGEKDEKR